MALGSLLERLFVKITGDTSEFGKSTADMARDVDRMSADISKKMQGIGLVMTGIGAGLSATVTPALIRFGFESMRAGQESAEALAVVEARLKSMGPASQRTSEQLQGLAEKLQQVSGIDDDAILRDLTSNLLTFGNVSGPTFDRASAAIVDMAAGLKMELQPATIMVGKALNDPIKGLAALRRVGIQFTEQQQEQIKAMAEAGNMAGAQSIMLAELERQFGGTAAAIKATDPWADMRTSFAEFQETAGPLIAEVVTPLIDLMTRLLQGFVDLPEPVQKVALVIGGIATAAGPVLVAVGSLVTAFGTVAPVLTPLISVIALFGKTLIGLVAATGPIGLAIAAGTALYLAWKNWDKIEPILRNLYNGVKQWVGDRMAAIIERTKRVVGSLIEPFKRVYDAVVGHSYIPDMVEGIAHWMGPRLHDAMVVPAQKAAQQTLEAFEAVQAGVEAVKVNMPEGPLTRPWEEMAEGLAKSQEEAEERFQRSIERMGTVFRGAFTEWINTGKFNWRRLLSDMVNDWEGTVNLLRKIGSWLGGLGKGAGTGGGGFWSTVGNVVKGIGSIFKFGGGRAFGGGVRAGMAYTVGEHGPEKFVAPANGHIIPNGAGGQGGKHITVNVFANDAVLADTVRGWVQGAINYADSVGQQAVQTAIDLVPAEMGRKQEGSFI